MFIYSSEKSDSTFILDFSKANASKCFADHFANSLTLKFFHSNGNRLEKIQADSELVICERKMKFWKNQINFDQAKASTLCDVHKKNWKMT